MNRKGSIGIVAALAAGLLGTGTASAAPASLAKQLSREISATVEGAMPSVVVIYTEATRYYQVFDLSLRRYAIPETMAGQGSGVIIDAQGHVLTSNHVIDKAQQIEVMLQDGTMLPAKLVGQDPSTDLAVIRIENKENVPLKPIAMGDSDALGIGELVIAAGAPFSLQRSISLGVVSAKGRSVGMLPYEDFIQTDASINPGNSGGPLVDLDGRLVGINAMIKTGGPYSQGNIGIGFAVPVNLARRAAESMIKTGRFVRPWIGIQPREVVRRGEEDQRGAPAGILIEQVFEHTPAAAAKLERGDLIVEANGAKVRTLLDLQRAIMQNEMSRPVRLGIQRGDAETLKVDVRTEPMPDMNMGIR